MWITVIRLLLLAATIGTGVAYSPFPGDRIVNASIGAAIGLVIIFFESRLRSIPARQVAGAFFGALIGVCLAFLVGIPLSKIPMGDGPQALWHTLVLATFVYLGLMLGMKKAEWFDPLAIMAYFRGTSTQRQFKILDTSVIIDGRIADICETGFIDGTMVIPQFVLKELQQVADSADSLKRNRGRRGLDILQKAGSTSPSRR